MRLLRGVRLAQSEPDFPPKVLGRPRKWRVVLPEVADSGQSYGRDAFDELTIPWLSTLTVFPCFVRFDESKKENKSTARHIDLRDGNAVFHFHTEEFNA